MHPRAWNLHDWAEVYFEGAGWVPVDQSFGIPTFADNPEEKMFFMGGIDSWRMIVNSDYSMPLVPEKKYPRSETVDFQAWRGGVGRGQPVLPAVELSHGYRLSELLSSFSIKDLSVFRKDLSVSQKDFSLSRETFKSFFCLLNPCVSCNEC